MDHAGAPAGVLDASAAESGGPLVSVARSRVGSTLRGKWHLDALLGVGGMAAVYAATHRNGRRAALKVLHPEVSLDSDCRERFLREGRVANAVGHEGAVKVLDDDVTDDGAVFLVLELLEGESLEERFTRLGGRLPETEVLWIADQLLDVLVAAHARGIVHRDLKPDNLFLTTSGDLKVLDFGIARLRGEWSTARRGTTNGGTMGTPAFMPPEQARGLWDEVDAQSDLFAVGATMYSLLSGRTVHDGRTPNEELLSAMTAPVRSLSSILPHVAGTVARVVDAALAFDKSNRWRDARSMQEAVRSAYLDRTGKHISMAPRPDVPERTASAMLALSRDMAVTKDAALVEARRKARQPRDRSRLVVAACGVVAGALVGFALLRPGYGTPSDGAASTPQAPPAVSAPPAALPASAAADDRISQPPVTPVTPAAAATDAHSASTTAAPKASAATKASTRPGCATPYVIDPVTHIKHWKLGCL